VERVDGRADVRLRGELDVSTVADVRGAVDPLLADATVHDVVLDLRELTFMDSSGVRLLLAIELETRGDGHALALVAGPPEVHRVLEITRLAQRFRYITPE
jgi:anti-anti-sigma factor